MAIRINLESQESCWRAYLNYHCYGNSMGITGEEMGAIVNRWGDQIPTWQKNAQTNDEVKYEFDDSEFEDYKTEGYNNAKEEHGEDVNTAGETARTTGDIVFGAGSTIAGITGLFGSSKLGALTKEGSKFGADKVTGFGGLGDIMLIVSAAMTFVTGLLGLTNVANKEEAEAIDSMKNEMGNQQAMLNNEVSNMESIKEEIISLEDEAQTANEEANSNIEDKKTDYDMYKRVYETLKAKIESGKPLDETEKKLYQKVVAILGTTSTAINDEVDNASSVVNDIYGDVEAYSSEYDNVAETIGNVQGFTNYAASVDKKTQDLCYDNVVAHGLNILAGAITMGKAIAKAATKALIWPLALLWGFIAAVAGAGSTMSGIAMSKQLEFAKNIGDEIAARKTTQDMETETLDIYGEELDAYDGSLDNLSEFEVLVPDDTAAPEGAPAVPTSAPPVTQTPNNVGSQNDDGAGDGTKKKPGANGANA